MALQLVYRAARPSLTTTTTSSGISLITQSTRPLSVSTILQGKPSPWGRNEKKGGEKKGGEQKLNYAERKKAREELAAQRPTYKIHKGKKDITEYPDEVRPPSRQSRFYDPDSSFAKRSLVHKLKTGQLSRELKELERIEGKLPSSLSAFATSKGEEVKDTRYSRKEKQRGRERDSRGPSNSDDIAAMIRGDKAPSFRDKDFKGSRNSDFKGSRGKDFGERDSRGPRDKGFGGKDRGFGGWERDSRPPRDNNFGGARDREAKPPRDNAFGARDRDSRPSRGGSFGGFRDRESRPPRDGAFGGSRDRDSRPARDGAFNGGRDRDSRPPRDGVFNGGRDRDSRPARDGGFSGGRDRDSRPPRDGAFNGGRDRDSRPPRENSSFGDVRDSRPPRDNAFRGSRETRPPRDNGFSSPRDSAFRRNFSDKPDFASRTRGDRSSSSFPVRDKDGPRPRKNDPISIPYTTAASQFLYGKSVVEAALNSSRRKLYKLYIYDGPKRENVEDNKQLRALADRKGVEVVTLRQEDDLRLLDKMSGSRPHNGFVLEASTLAQPPLVSLGPVPEAQEDYSAMPGFPVELGHQSAEDAAINGNDTFIPSKSVTHRPFVVVLDRILDPGNLGAILRTANFLGVTAVGITKFGGAKLTPVALKASSGAAESMSLFSIASLPEFLNSSRANGWVTYAAVAKEPTVHKLRRHLDLFDVEKTDPLKTQPCILILGSEGEGLDRLIVKKADYELSVPNMSESGAVDSLNVGIAAGLLCTSFLKGMTAELNGQFSGAVSGQEIKKGAEGLW